MSGNQTELLLGCDPQVRLVIIEDEGNLVFQIFATDPDVTDIDGLFFDLTDPATAENLTIWPKYDEGIGSNGENLTGYDVAPGALNQLNNGAQLTESHDVRLEFGTLPYSSGGDVDQAAVTFYVDGGASGLTIADLDLSSFTAVINSDGGNGLALTAGGGEPETQTVVAYSENFDHLWSPDQSAGITRDDGWTLQYGRLHTDGCRDGTLEFATVDTDGPVAFNLDARGFNLHNFEQSGSAGDSLRIEVQIDGGDWVLLDEFRVNDAKTALVGSNTGQEITGAWGDLSYSGGVLDTAEDSATFRMVSNITASDEIIRFDNVEILVAEEVAETELVEQVRTEDFNAIHDGAQSELIASDGNWVVCNGKLVSNGYYDGSVTTELVATDGPAALSFDIKADNIWNFEAGGAYGDSFTVETRIDGGDWQTLDVFEVDHAQGAFVGSQSGQTFGHQMTTLSYSGGVLDGATEGVEFRLTSDISANDEVLRLDNLQITTVDEVPVTDEQCADFEGLAAGTVVDDQFEGFTVSAQRAGDDETSQNDAMIFDTARPTGGDWDLGYEDRGNAIIISEDNHSWDPDDNYGGGTITFEFDEPSTVTSLDVLDIEEPGGTIDLFDAEGTLLGQVGIPLTGNNGAGTVELGFDGVSTMNVNLTGSGAVDDLCFTLPPTLEDLCGGQYEVAYDETFKEEDLVEDALAI